MVEIDKTLSFLNLLGFSSISTFCQLMVDSIVSDLPLVTLDIRGRTPRMLVIFLILAQWLFSLSVFFGIQRFNTRSICSVCWFDAIIVRDRRRPKEATGMMKNVLPKLIYTMRRRSRTK